MHTLLYAIIIVLILVLIGVMTLSIGANIGLFGKNYKFHIGLGSVEKTTEKMGGFEREAVGISGNMLSATPKDLLPHVYKY